MWFEELTGFTEQDAAQVKRQMVLQGDKLISLANGAVLNAGRLLMPMLAQLTGQAQALLDDNPTRRLRLSEVVADVQQLHADAANAGALFQVASQFNLLEMVSPDVTPEQGITCYQTDKTQGPACAIACGAGLIFRNYFVPVQGETGQSQHRQLNKLDQYGPALKALMADNSTAPMAVFHVNALIAFAVKSFNDSLRGSS